MVSGIKVDCLMKGRVKKLIWNYILGWMVIVLWFFYKCIGVGGWFVGRV